MSRDFRFNADTAVVDTACGKVQGYYDDGIYIFKGIPYAQASRFHDPVPVEHWAGVRNCTSYGYVCPLLGMPDPNNELLVPHRYWIMNENCQNLNIWTKGLDDHKRPVVVWLHGGGFEAGSAIEHIAYEGENMARLSETVVVSVNHRLNILGYFDLSDYGEEYANSGNAGTSDLVAALRWIHENISKFGGDADNVTLFGQSGGGCKITALMQTPEADGLFQKGLIMSGVLNTSVLKDSVGSGKYLAEAIMKELKADDVKDLEKIPYEVLASAYNKVRPEIKTAGYNDGGTPHPNQFYVGDPMTNGFGFRKESAGVKLMIGTVFGEFAGFAPTKYHKENMSESEQIEWLKKDLGEKETDTLLPLFRQAYPERPVIDLDQLDTIFRLPTYQYIHKRAALSHDTYSYLFNMDSVLDNGSVPWHCADVPYVFHNCQYVPTQCSPRSSELEEKVFHAFINFAKDGVPTAKGLPVWPSSTAEHEYTMVLDDCPRVKTDYDHELVALHDKLCLHKLMQRLMANTGMIQH